MVVDITTILFAACSFVVIYPSLGDFYDWNTAKQCHVIAGIIFTFLMIVQHVGGVLAFVKKRPNPKHRIFGKYIVSFGRVVSAIGWIHGNNINNAFIVTMASLPILIISFLEPPKPSYYNPFKKDIKKE